MSQSIGVATLFGGCLSVRVIRFLCLLSHCRQHTKTKHNLSSFYMNAKNPRELFVWHWCKALRINCSTCMKAHDGNFTLWDPFCFCSPLRSERFRATVLEALMADLNVCLLPQMPTRTRISTARRKSWAVFRLADELIAAVLRCWMPKRTAWRSRLVFFVWGIHSEAVIQGWPEPAQALLWNGMPSAPTQRQFQGLFSSFVQGHSCRCSPIVPRPLFDHTVYSGQT